MKKLKIPENISGLLHPYNDSFLADDSLSDKDVLLLSIYLIENTNNKSGASYDECKSIFVGLGRKGDNFRKEVYSTKQKSQIDIKNNHLFFLISGLKRLRDFIGQIGKTPVHIIKSGENFSAIKLFEEFLASEIKGEEVLLCDPYISPQTLYPFSILKGKINKIKILTSNVFDGDKFRDYVSRLEKEGNFKIEIKINKKLHDRYIISKDSCWSIGGSIKDFGNKDIIIKEVREVFDSIKDLFSERWAETS